MKVGKPACLQTKCANWSRDLGWGRGGARQSGEGGDNAEVRDTMEIASPVVVGTKEWWKKRSWAVESLQIPASKEVARKVPIGLLRDSLILQTLNLKDCCANGSVPFMC